VYVSSTAPAHSGPALRFAICAIATKLRFVGRALLCEDARIARREGSYGIHWEVLGWNEPAMQFYKSGEFFDDWRQVLLQADALKRLAEG
jgi:hypothetical protein